MKIDSVNRYQQRNINFSSASDITIEYALKHHAKYLPATMLKRVHELVSSGQGKKPVYEVHNEVYKELFEAQTLDEIRSKYTEFKEIKDATDLVNNRSKAIQFIKNFKEIKDFTLYYIKRLYTPTSQDKLTQEFGFTNRSLLSWLNKKLHINKLSGSYIQLLKMSNEKENRRIAELSRQAIYSNPEAQKYRLEKAAQAHRTPEYRAKKQQEMKDYYKKNPEAAEKTSTISKMTWDKCPEIKKALSQYTKSLGSYIRKVLSKKQTGANLTSAEKRIASKYYRDFWEQNPEYKSIYKKRRLEVIEELKKTNPA